MFLGRIVHPSLYLIFQCNKIIVSYQKEKKNAGQVKLPKQSSYIACWWNQHSFREFLGVLSSSMGCSVDILYFICFINFQIFHYFVHC